jgi:hypothetical protein
MVAAKTPEKTSPELVKVAHAETAAVEFPTVKMIPLEDTPEEEPPPEKATAADEFAQGLLQDSGKPAERPELASGSAGADQEVSTLFALLDPQKKNEDFSLGNEHAMDPADLGWKFHYTFKNKAAEPDVPFAGSTIVTDGETAGHFAEWCRISTPQFRRLNRLKFGQSILLGQKVRLECLSTLTELEQERKEYHLVMQQDYMKTCPHLQFKVHAVKRNESLWDLANLQYQTPLWLIQKYNPTKDLTQKIGSGENLRIPVCTKVAQQGE